MSEPAPEEWDHLVFGDLDFEDWLIAIRPPAPPVAKKAQTKKGRSHEDTTQRAQDKAGRQQSQTAAAPGEKGRKGRGRPRRVDAA